MVGGRIFVKITLIKRRAVTQGSKRVSIDIRPSSLIKLQKGLNCAFFYQSYPKQEAFIIKESRVFMEPN
jgi:hypothetical protein